MEVKIESKMRKKKAFKNLNDTKQMNRWKGDTKSMNAVHHQNKYE